MSNLVDAVWVVLALIGGAALVVGALQWIGERLRDAALRRGFHMFPEDKGD